MTVAEQHRQILQAEGILIHIGGFQQLTGRLIECLVETFCLDGLIDGVAPGSAVEMVDGKAEFAIAVGRQVLGALRQLVNLPEEGLVYLGRGLLKGGQHDLLAIEYHMIAIIITVNIRQRTQWHIHHLTVATQVDAVFLHGESDRSRSRHSGSRLDAAVTIIIGIVLH